MATERGTPQGGVISPLLANIALHGMEEHLRATCTTKSGKALFVRYADDFVVFHNSREEIEHCKQVLEQWLKGMGLELKPSKTRILHTSEGFDFLGFSVRQFAVGRTHSGKRTNGQLLGFKTIISPSAEAIKRHIRDLGKTITTLKGVSQEELIGVLNPRIVGWSNYYRTSVSKTALNTVDNWLYHKLRSWAKSRHPNKSMHWITHKYWRLDQGQGWTFGPQEGKALFKHAHTHIQRHTKVTGKASPYDGKVVYWAKRLSKHPLTSTTLARLLRDQQGTCMYCGLTFRDGDLIEIDHLIPQSWGGKDTYENLRALHRHCHDQRHGIHDKNEATEEPDVGKLTRPVLKTSGSGDTFA